MKLDEVALHHVQLPLKEPYELSFGTLRYFDVYLTEVTSREEKEWGEVVPLPGYSDTPAEQTLSNIEGFCNRIQGMEVGNAVEFLDSRIPKAPFAVSALAPPLERLSGSFDAAPCRMPLSGIISSGSGVEERVKAGVEEGFQMFKIKIHGDPAEDVELVSKVLESCDLPVRVDANQSYGFGEAERFVEEIEDMHGHERIEVLEQPFNTQDWKDTRELREASDIPVGVDESVWTVEDLERAAACADVVKLKLAKHGSFRRTIEMAEAAMDSGLEVVLGNGVAAGVSALYESAIWGHCGLDSPGENNGYLKVYDLMMVDEPGFEDGYMTPAKSIRVDEDEVADKAEESSRFC